MSKAGGIWVLAGVMATIGVPALVAGAVLLVRGINAMRRGAVIEAEVVRWDTRRLPAAVKRAPKGFGSRSRSTAIPSVRYVTADGQEIVATLDRQVTREMWVRYPVGSRMPVRIDPAHPRRAYDPGIGHMFVFPGLLVFAGALMTLLAMGMAAG